MDVDSTDGEKNSNAFPWVAVGIVAVIAVAGAVVALLLVNKKKSKTE